MEKIDIIRKSKRKIIVAMLILICLALICIGFVAYKLKDRVVREALDMQKLLVNNEQEEGQYVKITLDRLPVQMRCNREKDNQLYFVTDVNGYLYIVNMSSDANARILKSYNRETGRLDTPYELKGTITVLDSSTKKIAIGSSYIGIAGTKITEENFADYFDSFYIKANAVSDRELELLKCVTLVGVLCLIFAFGHCLPRLIKLARGDLGIYDEENMRKVLSKYVPTGESLIAGICAMAHRVDVKYIFRNCVYKEGILTPSVNTPAFKLHKFNAKGFEMYVGVTEKHLIICECEPCQYYYTVENLPAFGDIVGEEILYPVEAKDIGHCLALEDINGGSIKRIRGGSMRYVLNFINANKLKFTVKKSTFIEMPHHQEYQKIIISSLYNKK